MEKDTRGLINRNCHTNHCDRKRCNGSISKSETKCIKGAEYCTVAGFHGRIENKGPGVARLNLCQARHCFYHGSSGRGKWNKRECEGPCANNDSARTQRLKKHLGNKIQNGMIESVEDLSLAQRRVRENMYSHKSHRIAK